MDYRKYNCIGREILGCVVASIVVAGVLAWLFYRSWLALVLVTPVYIVVWKSYRKEKMLQRKTRLLMEFKDGMQALSAALYAGYSVENAWREAEKELRELHGEDSLMCVELAQLNAAVRMNRPIEKVLEEFAARSGCEDIESFAEIFSFAKRSGGNFPGIIRTTVQKMSGRIAVEQEIATMLAGKKLEGRIMDVMPVAILAYLNVSSGDFLEVLYGNALGVIVMTTALVVYAGALKLSERILDIRV
ncbi:MAG: hypothetical protein J6C37_01070 [Roseburia sp.]|nr:hypothetical protein [Roseburia sp.]